MERPQRITDYEKIETRRAMGYGDTMSLTEMDLIISKARTIDYKGLSGEAWAVLFSIFKIFGKRVSEIVSLRTSDIATRGEDLAITFTILKKKGRPPRRTKRITLENPYAQQITEYWEKIRDRGGFMFPGARSKHINRRYVADMLTVELGFEQPLYSRLFRHSLATELAKRGISAFKLKTWFDWEDISMADEYVSAAGMTTREISNRIW